MDDILKNQLVQAAADIRTGNGIAQSALNRLSGLIPGPDYQPFADELRGLQGRDAQGNQIEGRGLEAVAAKLNALATKLPDTIADDGS